MPSHGDGTVLVIGLVGVRVEFGAGQQVHGRVVHRQEDLARLDGGGHKRTGGDRAAPRREGHGVGVGDAESGGVQRWISTCAFRGASLRSTADLAVRVCVCHWATLPRPVNRTNGYSASGVPGACAEHPPGTSHAGPCERTARLQTAAGRSKSNRVGGVGPLQTARLVEMPMVANAGDVARAPRRQPFEHLKSRFRGGPLGEHVVEAAAAATARKIAKSDNAKPGPASRA